MITIQEVPLGIAAAVNRQIPEFKELYEIESSRRLQGKEHLIIVAYVEQDPAGYVIGYNRGDDDGSVYCWRAAVIPQFRQQGVLKALMAHFETWAQGKGYTRIKIKTRNKRRAMLSYLVRHGFHFVRVALHEPLEESRIYLEKEI